MKNKRLYIILLSIPLLLLTPFIAMQFTNEVNWSVSDFTIMGSMLLITGLICDLILKKVKSLKYRLLICSVVLILFLQLWAELAVSIFGTPLQVHNMQTFR